MGKQRIGALTAGVVSGSLFLVGCVPGRAETIIVDGKANIEVEPGVFRIHASLSSRDSSKVKLLQSLSDANRKLQEDIPNVENLESVSISSNGIAVEPTVSADCPQADRYNAAEFCDYDGFRGHIRILIEGSPASVAGNVLSYAVEQGVTSIDHVTWHVSNLEEHEERAIGAAIEDARRKAALLARASNREIGSPKTIQFGEGFANGENAYYAQDPMFRRNASTRALADVASPMSPTVSLDLMPEAIVVNAEITAAFPIRPKAE